MKQDANNMVIICNGFGLQAYKASLKRAIDIFETYEVPQHLEQAYARLTADNAPWFRPASLLRKALKDLLEGNADSAYLRQLVYGPAPAGEDTRPLVAVTPADTRELKIWLMDHNFETTKLEHAVVDHVLEGNLSILNELSTLKPLYDHPFVKEKGVAFMDEELLDGAKLLRKLRNAKWKDNASEARVISLYLEFVNDVTAHRDVKYSLVPIED